ncbi:hypothetical protein ACFL3C_03515 [Patescibacteria group bacterium]
MEIVSYLFSPVPGSTFTYDTAVYIYAAALFVIAILIKVLLAIKKNNKALKKVLRATPGQFAWTAILLAILTASRNSGVPYLSMRTLLFIIIALSFFYIGFTIYKMIKKYPEMKEITKPKVRKEQGPSYTTSKK